MGINTFSKEILIFSRTTEFNLQLVHSFNDIEDDVGYSKILLDEILKLNHEKQKALLFLFFMEKKDSNVMDDKMKKTFREFFSMKFSFEEYDYMNKLLKSKEINIFKGKEKLINICFPERITFFKTFFYFHFSFNQIVWKEFINIFISYGAMTLNDIEQIFGMNLVSLGNDHLIDLFTTVIELLFNYCTRITFYEYEILYTCFKTVLNLSNNHEQSWIYSLLLNLVLTHQNVDLSLIVMFLGFFSVDEIASSPNTINNIKNKSIKPLNMERVLLILLKNNNMNELRFILEESDFGSVILKFLKMNFDNNLSIILLNIIGTFLTKLKYVRSMNYFFLQSSLSNGNNKLEWNELNLGVVIFFTEVIMQRLGDLSFKLLLFVIFLSREILERITQTYHDNSMIYPSEDFVTLMHNFENIISCLFDVKIFEISKITDTIMSSFICFLGLYSRNSFVSIEWKKIISIFKIQESSKTRQGCLVCISFYNNFHRYIFLREKEGKHDYLDSMTKFLILKIATAIFLNDDSILECDDNDHLSFFFKRQFLLLAFDSFLIQRTNLDVFLEIIQNVASISDKKDENPNISSSKNDKRELLAFIVSMSCYHYSSLESKNNFKFNLVKISDRLNFPQFRKFDKVLNRTTNPFSQLLSFFDMIFERMMVFGSIIYVLNKLVFKTFEDIIAIKNLTLELQKYFHLIMQKLLFLHPLYLAKMQYFFNIHQCYPFSNMLHEIFVRRVKENGKHVWKQAPLTTSAIDHSFMNKTFYFGKINEINIFGFGKGKQFSRLGVDSII